MDRAIDEERRARLSREAERAWVAEVLNRAINFEHRAVENLRHARRIRTGSTIGVAAMLLVLILEFALCREYHRDAADSLAIATSAIRQRNEAREEVQSMARAWQFDRLDWQLDCVNACDADLPEMVRRWERSRAAVSK